LGIVFPELGFGPDEHFIQFIIGIKIPVVLSNGILEKCTGIRPLGGGCFFITQGAVLIFIRFLQVILNPSRPKTVQEKEKEKLLARGNDPFHPSLL
jgi:hypothetical protein